MVADPNIRVNRHEIEVEGDFGRFSTRVENVPSPRNPKDQLSGCALSHIHIEVHCGADQDRHLIEGILKEAVNLFDLFLQALKGQGELFIDPLLGIRADLHLYIRIENRGSCPVRFMKSSTQ